MEYRYSEGFPLKYNVRKCFGCGEIKPKDKRTASIHWRCKECRMKAKTTTKETTNE